MKVKIYGYGWVGKAMHKLFPTAAIHDPIAGPTFGYYPEQNSCPADIAFVCVPTPLKNGKLDCSIVEQVVREAPEPIIVIRSTVMPGTCEGLLHELDDPIRNIIYQPEYLGETVDHPLFDMQSRQFMVLGHENPYACRKVIELYQSVYNANVKIRQVSLLEAEIIKLSENRAIAFKVAQCQELYDACESAGVDYYTIREAVYGDDPRFNLWFSMVYPERRGFNSKCIPKDVYGWAAWAESVGYTPELTRSMLAVNEKLIHPVSKRGGAHPKTCSLNNGGSACSCGELWAPPMEMDAAGHVILD